MAANESATLGAATRHAREFSSLGAGVFHLYADTEVLAVQMLFGTLLFDCAKHWRDCRAYETDSYGGQFVTHRRLIEGHTHAYELRVAVRPCALRSLPYVHTWMRCALGQHEFVQRDAGVAGRCCCFVPSAHEYALMCDALCVQCDLRCFSLEAHATDGSAVLRVHTVSDMPSAPLSDVDLAALGTAVRVMPSYTTRRTSLQVRRCDIAYVCQYLIRHGAVLLHDPDALNAHILE